MFVKDLKQVLILLFVLRCRCCFGGDGGGGGIVGMSFLAFLLCSGGGEERKNAVVGNRSPKAQRVAAAASAALRLSSVDSLVRPRGGAFLDLAWCHAQHSHKRTIP